MIEFTDSELEGFSADFNETFEMISKINELSLEKVENTFHVNDTVNHLRADEIQKSLGAEEATKNAKEEKYGYFKTVKFVD